MPGISVHCSFNKISDSQRRAFDRACELVRLDDRYERKSLFRNDNIFLSFVSYPQYPRSSFEDESLLIFVEGCIYNKSRLQLERELLDLAPTILDGKEHSDTMLRNWLLGCSGEFLVVFLDKLTSELVLITDPLAQLPLFSLERSGEVFLSRELKFIVSAADQRLPNKDAMGEYLSHGVITGNGTFCKDIRTRPQTTKFVFSLRRKQATVSTVSLWPDDSQIDHSTTVEEYAQQLAIRYMEALENRLDRMSHTKPLLALSGGLDSRAALAGLTKSGVAFAAETGLAYGGINAGDLKYGKEIARLFQCDWRSYQYGPIRIEDLFQVIHNQCGGSSTAMAASWQGYEFVADDFGYDTTLVTGDGGFFVRRPQESGRKLENLDDLLDLTIGKLTTFDINTVDRLLNLKDGGVRSIVADRFADYPEPDLEGKYRHFQFIDRPRRLVLDGEDRTRGYFWLIAPLWDLEFFKVIMRVPGSYKSHFRLYSAFLKALDKRTLEVPYANINARIDSFRGKLYSWAKSFILPRPRLFRVAARLGKRVPPSVYQNTQLDDFLRKEIIKSSVLEETFDLKLLENLLSSGLPRMKYHRLVTVLLSALMIEKGFPPPKKLLSGVE